MPTSVVTEGEDTVESDAQESSVITLMTSMPCSKAVITAWASLLLKLVLTTAWSSEYVAGSSFGAIAEERRKQQQMPVVVCYQHQR